ncbi:chitin synthase CHS1 [Sugiyamaella lignohabitans]|uniref:chitin synthase n=1 Tax=Sugiyamaella lignohabitans TaxID=796027 RepID=A0A167BYB2_9ASCO|nr:chitin synthase CHS1 [Sugiyamaella lignohabitans]ANB10975.1 chitin synthase CHS1 [Sugiyamaella lignohabitans]
MTPNTGPESSGGHAHNQYYSYDDNPDPYGHQDQEEGDRVPLNPSGGPDGLGHMPSPNPYQGGMDQSGMGFGNHDVHGGPPGGPQGYAEDDQYYEYPIGQQHHEPVDNQYYDPYAHTAATPGVGVGPIPGMNPMNHVPPPMPGPPPAPIPPPQPAMPYDTHPINPYSNPPTNPYGNPFENEPAFESQYNLPQEPESYLLKPVYPPPQPLHHAMDTNHSPFSSYFGSTNDDVDDFHPFPVQGDQYALNTYEDDDDTEDSDSSDGRDDSFAYQPPVAPQPIPAGAAVSGMPLPSGPTPPPIMGAPLPVAPPPNMQPRRAKTMKRVRLFKGNLVLDCPVSGTLLSQFPDDLEGQREFTHMRYSAATCDPKDFKLNGFTMRQNCYTHPRATELFIVITIYNESDILLGKTLQGVFRNIKHLSSRTRSKTWGKDAWKKVVVCVVADGREKLNPRARALMAALGVYQDGLAKNMVNDRPVDAHIYEYTTRVGISHVDTTVKLVTEKTVPVQMIFCLKEHNKKKINSHRWFFQAFGPILNPNICVLLDAGTQPGHDSIYHLWKAFDVNPHVGGACGEITAGLGTGFRKLLNPLVAAQNFEYKMSNILDKPLESVFGFISVLPGAFSAYRYVALQNEPLEKYFKGETLHDSGAGIFTANMYLAEDRILCYELVAKRGDRWLLKYVKSAHAETDVPDKLDELVLQRRRWLNGSFFAAVYAQVHMFAIWRSSHSILRKLSLHLEFLYQMVSMLFSWFSIGNYFLVFRILTSSLSDSSLGFAPGKILSVLFLWIYAGCLVTIFVLSFGNRPSGTAHFYYAIVAFFAFLMAYLMFAAIYISVKSVEYAICANGGFSPALVVKNQTFRDLVISILSTYALYFISSFLFFEPWHMFTSFLQYLLISPSYINVLNVYAFCNIHDISWGTKGDTSQKMDLGVAKLKTTQSKKEILEVDVPTSKEEINSSYLNQISLLRDEAKEEKKVVSKEDKNIDYYAQFRSAVVLSWIFTNVALVAVVLNTAGLNVFNSNSNSSNPNSGTLKRGLDMGIELLKRQTPAAPASPAPAAGAGSGSCSSIGVGEDVQTQIYLSVILWSVAALAAFRFIGSVWYLVLRLMGR